MVNYSRLCVYVLELGGGVDYCFKFDEERSRLIPANLSSPLEKLAFMLKSTYQENKSNLEFVNGSTKPNTRKFNEQELKDFFKYLSKF